MNIQKKNVGIILFITGFIILSENSGLIFNNLLLKDNTKEDLDIKPAYIPLLPWENNGTVICNADYDQNSPVMCSDGAGGVIIAWRDYRNGSNWDIYAQRFSSAGRAMWDPNGIPICTDYYHQYDPQICSDGSGGAIIAWRDKRGLDDPTVQMDDSQKRPSSREATEDKGVDDVDDVDDKKHSFSKNEILEGDL